jgi:hypothetical protein
VGSRFEDWVYWHFFTITFDDNSSHIELLLDGEPLAVFFLDLGLVSSLLLLGMTLQCDFGRTMQKTPTRVEAGSYTSIVELRVVRGDEKGSLESETVKYGHEPHGTRTRK